MLIIRYYINNNNTYYDNNIVCKKKKQCEQSYLALYIAAVFHLQRLFNIERDCIIVLAFYLEQKLFYAAFVFLALSARR